MKAQKQFSITLSTGTSLTYALPYYSIAWATSVFSQIKYTLACKIWNILLSPKEVILKQNRQKKM